jgi:predicted RNA-binding Zn-ribbon protein involved in translation (DUF1610 family)
LEITCYNCKTTYDVTKRIILSARLKYVLGHKEFSFACPNCGAKSILSSEAFRSNDIPQAVIPVTGAQSVPGPAYLVGHAPTNPVEGPGLEMKQQEAIVRGRGAEARIDHSIWSEVVGAFSKGEKLSIVDTWSDGENTWVQLGPERWINLEQDGEPVLDLVD